jgi:hypothetical protein
MATHVPNRRGLDDAEISELDDIISEYNAVREQARNALIAAQTAYQETIGHASERRDDRILGIIDASGGRGTQSRVVEHLGMNPSYLSIRLRKARDRVVNDESVTPHQEGDASSSTHKPPTQRR